MLSRDVAIPARRGMLSRRDTMEKDPSELPGMRRNPWKLSKPGGNTHFTAFRDTTLRPPSLVVRDGEKELHYHLRCLEYEKPAAGTVEAWARSAENSIGGWYGLKKGLRGGFATFIPPIMVTLNLAEVEGTPSDGRMRAI
jgi:hypothetical protein